MEVALHLQPEEVDKQMIPTPAATQPGHETGPARFTRDAPPAHYIFKIESLSLLTEFLGELQTDSYESNCFEVGGYKWKLSLYPNGDKKRGGDGYISLYLVLAKENDLRHGSEINVSYRLFVYDQIQDTYLTIQDNDNKLRRFHTMKRERGFSKLLPLSTFNDQSNGYLVDDQCIFGAEIFVCNCTGKGESFCIIKNPRRSKYIWKIKSFSNQVTEPVCSPRFTAGSYDWYLRLHPKGDRQTEFLSLYLCLIDNSKLLPEQKLFVKYNLLVENHKDASNHKQRTGHCQMTCSDGVWGYTSFLALTELSDNKKGFLKNDELTVEANILLLSDVKCT